MRLCPAPDKWLIAAPAASSPRVALLNVTSPSERGLESAGLPPPSFLIPLRRTAGQEVGCASAVWPLAWSLIVPFSPARQDRCALKNRATSGGGSTCSS